MVFENHKRFLLTLSLGLSLSISAQAATVVWDFNLPATSTSSQNPPYPSVATLTLTDTVDGVQFTLDPNEANPGYEANSTVNSLNIIFSGSADLSSMTYRWDSGPVADAESFGNNNDPLVAVVPPPSSASNMDSGYTSDDGQLRLSWDNPDFNVTAISVWTILGTTISDDFTGFATHNSNPSPSFGIFSVSPISLPDLSPTPSNWVTGPAPVPVPAALWLFASGLIGLGAVRRRERQA